MRMTDIIRKKRDGLELSPEEIAFVVRGVSDDSIPDYQTAAFLMAVFFRGMNTTETVALTRAMMHSGEVIDLSGVAGIKVDKHSTGGVGDKTSLVLGPLLASCGVKVAKMTGKGMGHTGGTVDKFSVFPGMNMELSREGFIRNVNRIGIALTGQSAQLVPADKKFYALRDVTATVEQVSLIASSIMSKKLAAGADAIVLDVKTGHGAFTPNPDVAFRLAELMVGIAKEMGRKAVALVTDMSQPLGHAVGNALEVKEAIMTLRGKGPEDLRKLCVKLGTEMLLMAELAGNPDTARQMLERNLDNGEALQKLRALVENQGGNPSLIDDFSQLPSAQANFTLRSNQAGFVEELNARLIGEAAVILGAGRMTKDSLVDLAAGLYLHKKVGDYVEEGEPLAELFASDQGKIREAVAHLSRVFKISEDQPVPHALVLGKIE